MILSPVFPEHFHLDLIGMMSWGNALFLIQQGNVLAGHYWPEMGK